SDPDNKLGNYTVTTNNGTLTIAPALLSVIANNKSRTYGAANPAFDGVLTGILNGDNITAIFTTTATPASPVGTYPITPALSDPDNKLGNYTVTTNNGILTITSALLSVTANNKSRTYGAANPAFDGILTGIQNGDNITAIYTTTATPASPAGSYAITPILQDPTGKLGNYAVTINNGTLTIAPAPLSVSANNKSRTYGTANPVFDGILTGLQNGDNITAIFTTTATPASPVGTYPITPVLQDPTGKLGNYSVTVNNGVLTVTPTALVITADNKTKILNAPNPVFTVSYSGFVLGEGPNVLGGSLVCTSTAVTGSPVGTYPIACSGQTATNYSISYVPGTLSVIYASSGRCFTDPGHVILPPIRSDGTSMFERERDVEAEFRVCDNNGIPIGTPGTVTSFRIVQVISGGVVNNVNLPVPSEDRTSMFHFEGHEKAWAFDIEFSKLPAGSAFVFRVTLNDGSTIDFAFNLKTDRDRDRDDDRDDRH
ncbi:MAG TPA: MBG domain-containing protein, partial [Candidatus Angelobacter sp.]|nr:MBG domain-containing protein [Candidatus Angelobacter sp.]